VFEEKDFPSTEMSENFNYGLTLFLRRLFGLFFVNPEFRFIAKIIFVLILLGVVLLVFKQFVGS